MLTWLACSWRVRLAQKRSRGLAALQTLRSPTCGPFGVLRRKSAPRGTCQAAPLRGGMVRVARGSRWEGVAAVAARRA